MCLPLKTCLTLTLILSTTLVGCSLLGCQPPLSERPGRSSVTVTIESPPLKAQQNLSEALTRSLLSSKEGQALLQRALIKLYLEGQGVQDPKLKGIPSWETLIQASAQLQGSPTTEQLTRLYERRYPQGVALRGVQLTLSASSGWRAHERAHFEPSLKYWARNSLSKARQALLQGGEVEGIASDLGLSTLKGEPLRQHLKALPSPHLRGSLKRLRAGELSSVIEHEQGACLYLVTATPAVLKESLPRAVSELSKRLNQQLSERSSPPQALTTLAHQGDLTALCLDLSLAGLKGPTGRAFDQWLRARVLSLKELGALNQSTLEAFALRAEPLRPEEWPPQLQRASLTVKLPSPGEPIEWHQAQATDTLWLVSLRGREATSFEQVKQELTALFHAQKADEINLRLLIEQAWEELSPQLSLTPSGGQAEELELSEPELD